jgi:hypothetical protein
MGAAPARVGVHESRQIPDLWTHSSAKNFISAALSRHRFFIRCGLNFTSCLRKRSGVIDKFFP